MQVSIHLDTSGTCQKCGVKPLNQWDKSSDFPAINQNFSGSKNSYVYAATTSGSRKSLQHFPFDTVVKLNTVDESVSTWSVGNRRFIGEPIFVPKGTEEGEGYLLVVEVSKLQKIKLFTFVIAACYFLRCFRKLPATFSNTTVLINFAVCSFDTKMLSGYLGSKPYRDG